MKNKDLIKSTINIAFGAVAMNAVNNTNLPQPLKTTGNLVIGTAILKDTGKKLKVL